VRSGGPQKMRQEMRQLASELSGNMLRK